VSCGRTDRWRDVTKLIVIFCNFVSAPENYEKLVRTIKFMVTSHKKGRALLRDPTCSVERCHNKLLVLILSHDSLLNNAVIMNGRMTEYTVQCATVME
jgi:hypothetical protein